MSFFTGRRQNEDTSESEQSASHIGFDTVLSASTVLEGTLKSQGNIRLDGTFSGKLDITGNVLVGETAEIDADIEARNISIAGKVRGNVIGNKVQLLKTGHIWGDIQANSLTTEDGAFIDGKIAMKLKPSIEETPIELDDDTIASVETELDKTEPNLDDDVENDAEVNEDEAE